MRRRTDGRRQARPLSQIRHLDESHPYIQRELSDIREQIVMSTPANGQPMKKMDMLKRLCQKGTRNRIAIGLFLMACQNLTGVNVSISDVCVLNIV